MSCKKYHHPGTTKIPYSDRCNSLQCFSCYPPGDWGVLDVEWEELRGYEIEEWRDKLKVWDKQGRPGRRPGVAHTEWGIDSKPYRVDEYGQIISSGGVCILQ